MVSYNAIRLHLTGVLICATLLHACGGGGDGGGIGGSGITPISNPDFSYGTITGFGSVIINGERYNTDQSEFLIDGVSGSQADLALGMLVSANVDFDQMRASRVSYDSSVLGPLATVDALAKRINVLGQTIIIGADTILDELTLAQLNPGNFVQLTGIRDATGSLRATWIARASSTDQVRVTGNIANLQTGDEQFSIGQLSIDYNAADLSGLNSALVTGTPVIVSASAVNLDTASMNLSAASIVPAALAQLDAGRRIEIEGIVSEVLSATRFSLDGRTVSTNGNTIVQLVGGAPATYAAVNSNTRLEVEGTMNADGTVNATRVIVIPSDESRLAGPVESLAVGSQTLRVLGIDISTTSRTRYDSDDGVAGFSQLGIGSYVEVDASFIDNSLVAARIEIEDPDEEASLRGPVTSLDVDASVLEVMGVALIDGGNTEYENLAGQEVDRASFLQSLRIGDLVEASWDEFQSTALPPDEVEVED